MSSSSQNIYIRKQLHSTSVNEREKIRQDVIAGIAEIADNLATREGEEKKLIFQIEYAFVVNFCWISLILF